MKALVDPTWVAWLWLIRLYKDGKFKIGVLSKTYNNASRPLLTPKNYSSFHHWRNPFNLVHRSEAVIPAKTELEISESNIMNRRIITMLRANLDLIDEVREDAHTHIERYKQRIVNAYNRRVRKREIQIGDLVLRRASVLGPVGKLVPNWEGPYKITGIIKFGAYELEDINGLNLKTKVHSVNSTLLKAALLAHIYLSRLLAHTSLKSPCWRTLCLNCLDSAHLLKSPYWRILYLSRFVDLHFA
ncbi:hypothetical protein Sango_1924300 [Sesamum angolense]|uniref:Uncharacterized protein n=1 Tax=Sesamum angolense TaxID=2727404 RepID=A0AAE1WDT2_9LAMI|nr:hypothetical protein Sango_1924300 [Sesamum angolense]